MQTGEVKEEREIHEKQINDIKMSPDGTHFITASSDKTAKLVDTQTLEVSCLSCHGGSCHLHVLGGNLCVPCCGDGRVVLPESPVGVCVHSASCLSVQVLKTYQSDRPINSADISPIFDHIVLGGGQEASQVRPKQLQSARWRARCRSIQGMRRHGACPAARQLASQHDG